MRVIFVAAALAAVGLAAGCGGGAREQPKFGDLVPVAGVVVQGGAPVSGGVVEFIPEKNKDDFMINSEVGGDGKYSLTTVRLTDSRGERKPGVPPGKYRVNFRPPLANQAPGASTDTIELATPVNVTKAETDLKIEVPGKKR
jgi:hypothetical protein